MSTATTIAGSKEIRDLIEKEGVEIVDLRFCDLPGLMQHFSMPARQLNDDGLVEGYGFDGSSIRGFQEIQESDMILLPDLATGYIDPFTARKTLVLHCWILDPVTREPYLKDPRFIAKKAEHHLASTGVATHSYWGPEAEFYILDSVRYDQNPHSGYYFLDSEEGIWNSGAIEDGGNKGYKPRYKEGYFPVAPTDHFQDLRSEMIVNLEKVGIEVEVHHHEVGTAGQAEIDMGFAPLLRMADNLMIYKYVVKNTALSQGKTVTFMPKPIFQDNGSGMHVHQSLWLDDEPLFHNDNGGYANLSEVARWYIGGLLAHAPALLALVAPTTNSYRRLVPGYEAPVNLVYSQRNRSAAVRIPVYSSSPRAKRIEFRCPDPSCNPYLAFSAMLMAGLDGIKRNIEPAAPLDKDIYELSPKEAASIAKVPRSLSDALEALEEDHDFLTEGDVFTPEVIETWIEFKRERELDAIDIRPHPWEFHLYFDI